MSEISKTLGPLETLGQARAAFRESFSNLAQKLLEVAIAQRTLDQECPDVMKEMRSEHMPDDPDFEACITIPDIHCLREIEAVREQAIEAGIEMTVNLLPPSPNAIYSEHSYEIKFTY